MFETEQFPASAIEALNLDTTRLFIIQSLLRPGLSRFAEELEHRHYPPGTPANDLFEVMIFNWTLGPYGIIAIPLEHRNRAEAICRRLHLRLAEGVPALFDSPDARPAFRCVGTVRQRDGRPVAPAGLMMIERFPLHSERTVTLEPHHRRKGPIIAGLWIG